MRVEEGFQPPPFERPHPYVEDIVLPSLLKRLLPAHLRDEIETDLIRWGEEVRGPIQAIAALCDAPNAQPTIRQYDQWGRRVDELVTSEGWRTLKAITFKEGLISIAYEREKYAEWARIYSFAKITVWNADARMILCPFSMTDGCARVLELHGTPEMKRDVLPRLLSREPLKGFTAGQWMTERPGGSDLSQSETTAKFVTEISPDSLGSQKWELNGFKWFSSATDGNVSLALARTGPIAQGSRSLSLFLVPLRLPLLQTPNLTTLGIDTSTLPRIEALTYSNGIHLHRLKNKIGTHALPTAELSLNNTTGYIVGQVSQGVKTISPVLNITRLHSSVSSLSCLSRSLQIARSYANVREITSGSGGKRLRDLSLHTHTLAKVAVLYRALAHLTFGVIHLLGRSENNNATVQELAMLRLLTPVAKGYVASYAVSGMEECMVALGGQGYMEENGIGRMIRDSLVEKIWEGTVNVLALDVVRAARGGQSVAAFASWGIGIISRAPTIITTRADAELKILSSGLATLQETLVDPSQIPSAILPRPIFFLLGHVASALFLLEHAKWSTEEREPEAEIDIDAFVRWVNEGPAGAGIVQAQADVRKTWSDWRETQIVDDGLVYGHPANRSAKL